MLSRQSETLTFDVASQQLIHSTEAARIPKQISYIFLGLHKAKFAPSGMRLILFLMGLFSCALIATGSIMWLNQRVISNKMHLGSRTVSWLNKATLGGLPIAIMTLFYANRLLPVDMVDRSEQEVSAFFISWLLVAVVAKLVKASKWWSINVYVIAVSCLFLPLLDLILPEHYLLLAIESGNWTYLGVNVGFILAGAFSFWLASFLRATQSREDKLRRDTAASGIKTNVVGVTEC